MVCISFVLIQILLTWFVAVRLCIVFFRCVRSLFVCVCSCVGCFVYVWCCLFLSWTLLSYFVCVCCLLLFAILFRLRVLFVCLFVCLFGGVVFLCVDSDSVNMVLLLFVCRLFFLSLRALFICVCLFLFWVFWVCL